MLTKFATFDVIEARLARKGTPRMRTAHKHAFDYTPRPGFLYVRSRAISSRTNDNFDNFPAEEIEKGYHTFIGKPVFVNHHNDDHRRARGVIIDAALHKDANPDGTPDTWVEVLMEVDAVKFPKLAQAILVGEIERTSMGTDVEYSLCSVCGNKAATPLEYCKHIPKMKGMKIKRVTASGETEEVLVYEKCYGLRFFENSLLVEEPADPTAFFLGVDDRGLAMTGSKVEFMMSAEGAEAWKEYIAAHQSSWRLAEGDDPEGWYKSQESYGDAYGRNKGKNHYWRDGAPLCGATGRGGRPPMRGEQTNLLYNYCKACNKKAPEWRQATSGKHAARQLTFTHPGTGETFTRTTDADYRWVSFKPGSNWSGGGIAWHTTEEAARRRSSEVYRLPAQPGGSSTLMGTPMAPDSSGEKVPIDYGPGRQVCPNCVGAGSYEIQTAVSGTQTVTCFLCEGSGYVMRNSEGTIVGTGSKRTASRRRGIGEMKAPAEIDTLRDEFCPVCGESDSFDGDQCRVCNYIRPPQEFMDPDLEKAKEIDLRQEQTEQTVDEDGNPIDDPDDPNAAGDGDNPFTQEQPGEVDATGDEPAMDSDADEGVDPEAEAEEDQPQPDDSEDAGSDEDSDDEDEDDEDGSDSPPWLKDKKKPKKSRREVRERTGGRPRMGPTLKLLADQEHRLAKQARIINAQQRQIQALRGGLAFIARLAGVENEPRYVAMMKAAQDENPANAGWAVDGQPAAEAPAQSSEDALGEVNNEAPEGGSLPDAVDEIGATSEADVAADAQTDVASPETVLDEPLDLNEQDVEAPVAGTDDLGEGAPGQAGSGRTEIEVRVGDPNDPTPAFQETGWTEAAKEGRFVAALRLARLRLAVGIERGEDVVIATTISQSSTSNADIQKEISTLEQVTAARRAQRQDVPRQLVPRSTVKAQRSAPSLRSDPYAENIPVEHVASAGGAPDDEFLFE